MVCKQGHTYSDSLACPTCAQEGSARMLRDFLERAVRSREKTYRVLDHIVVNADYWRRSLAKQGVALNELYVPALCGALVSLAEVGRVFKKPEQEHGKCARCEARLVALASEARAAV